MTRDTDLDLQSLRVVRAIAEHGTISAAARAIGYSQPAVSRQLRRAEQRLGTPLLVKAGRGVRLTESGRVLARHALAVTAALDAAGSELAELASGRLGTLRLAAFPTASSTIVPRLLAALREQHPGIAVNYLEAEPPESVALLRDGAADLAIAFSYPGDPGGMSRRRDAALRTVELFREPVLAVLPIEHPLAAQVEVSLAELADAGWIAGCPLCRGHLVAACASVGFAPRIELETDNPAAVLGLVGAGLGVALLPRLAVATAPVPAGVAVRATRPSSERSIEAVIAADTERVPVVAAALSGLAALDGALWGLDGV